MHYEYKMVQMPSTVQVEKQYRKHAAAHYLEALANEQAGDGWEFHRIDRVATVTNPGVVASLLGAQPASVEHTVVTFRRATPQIEIVDEPVLMSEEPAMPPAEAALPLEETGVPLGAAGEGQAPADAEAAPAARHFPPKDGRAA